MRKWGALRFRWRRRGVDFGWLWWLLFLGLRVRNGRRGVRLFDVDLTDAHRKPGVHGETQGDECVTASHGYCFSTLMANLVMPSTFAKSITATTLPWRASSSAVITKFTSLDAACAARNCVTSSAFVVGLSLKK